MNKKEFIDQFAKAYNNAGDQKVNEVIDDYFLKLEKFNDEERKELLLYHFLELGLWEQKAKEVSWLARYYSNQNPMCKQILRAIVLHKEIKFRGCDNGEDWMDERYDLSNKEDFKNFLDSTIDDCTSAIDLPLIIGRNYDEDLTDELWDEFVDKIWETPDFKLADGEGIICVVLSCFEGAWNPITLVEVDGQMEKDDTSEEIDLEKRTIVVHGSWPSKAEKLVNTLVKQFDLGIHKFSDFLTVKNERPWYFIKGQGFTVPQDIVDDVFEEYLEEEFTGEENIQVLFSSKLQKTIMKKLLNSFKSLSSNEFELFLASLDVMKFAKKKYPEFDNSWDKILK